MKKKKRTRGGDRDGWMDDKEQNQRKKIKKIRKQWEDEGRWRREGGKEGKYGGRGRIKEEGKEA